MTKHTKPHTWPHFVLVQHGIGFGLTTGVAIPLLNATFRPDPGYDLLRALTFSVPFFVGAWLLFGVLRWRKESRGTAGCGAPLGKKRADRGCPPARRR